MIPPQGIHLQISKQLNSAAQLERRGRELHEFANRLASRNKAAKTQAERNALEPELKRLEAAFEDLNHEKGQLEATQAFSAKMGPSYGNSKGHDALGENKAVSRQSPLTVPVEEYRGLYEAAVKRLPSYRIDCDHFSDNVSTKAAFTESSFASGTLPAILIPSLSLDLPYEPDRAFTHFKGMPAPEARAVEYLQHTANTNPAAAVAELGVKPDLGLQLTSVSTSYIKIAALASISMEALDDFSAFMSWVPSELMNAIIDAETNQVVNGSGSGANMLGLLNTSGTLTRAIGSDTPIDCVRKAINDIRIGSSFAQASLALMHPTTWADLTLQKATTGQYLLDPENPARLGDLHNIFGCRVVTNTYIAPGTAVVCDPNWIYAWTRRGLTIDLNSHGSDANTNYWTQNATSFRCEERIALGVARPTAVNIVTGLPSS
jgi:hypothetical protein